ncbi:DUF418 domain-containing protein [Nocardiopsis tropica]|uniref:DUF418 domain-containing protein n=1 Tax=Nocardiopsis tropica TaxID=109330 RepID=UPI0031D0FC70
MSASPPGPPSAGEPPERPPGPHRPTPVARRALAPDLARGLMLLFIALVNVGHFLDQPYDAEAPAGAADRAVALVQAALVDRRAIPLFAFLFGYGTVQLLRRLDPRGDAWAGARRILRRRGMWMVLIGLVHGVLLLPVDIIGTYGLTLLLFAGLLRARDRTLLAVGAGVITAYAVLPLAWVLVSLAQGPGPAPQGEPALTAVAVAQRPEPVAALAESLASNFTEWLLYTPVTMLMFVVPPAALGVWAARRRVLEEPERHRALLWSTAAGGLGLAVLAGLPHGLVGAGLLDTWVSTDALSLLQEFTGPLGGLGWSAVFGLAAGRVLERGAEPSGLTRAVAATGQRSMTSYLLQSVVFTAVFAPFAGGLGGSTGAAGAAAVALLTWIATVVLSELQRLTGHRGPAETLLRRLTYGGRPRER